MRAGKRLYLNTCISYVLLYVSIHVYVCIYVEKPSPARAMLASEILIELTVVHAVYTTAIYAWRTCTCTAHTSIPS